MSEAQDIDIRKNVQFGVHDGDVLTGECHVLRKAQAPTQR